MPAPARSPTCGSGSRWPGRFRTTPCAVPSGSYCDGFAVVDAVGRTIAVDTYAYLGPKPSCRARWTAGARVTSLSGVWQQHGVALGARARQLRWSRRSGEPGCRPAAVHGGRAPAPGRLGTWARRFDPGSSSRAGRAAPGPSASRCRIPAGHRPAACGWSARGARPSRRVLRRSATGSGRRPGPHAPGNTCSSSGAPRRRRGVTLSRWCRPAGHDRTGPRTWPGGRRESPCRSGRAR